MTRLLDDSMTRKETTADVIPLESKLIQHFTDLRVYRAAFDVSLEIHRESLNFPKIEQFALGNQIRRASKSICANIAEGFGKQRFSAAEFNRYITIAAGSAEEMKVWISYSEALGYFSKTQAGGWTDRYDHISRMLTKLHAGGAS